ncbi:hypothetical protein SNE40_000369 [Patella caerulea]|uniref:Uncharacterized protein n=1 Tax=Patella caerulea TaxID=87958 RepID=A0AAN8KDQ5_PATCE
MSGPHCKQLGISFEWLNGCTGSSKPLTSSVTNGVIIELLILKKKHNYSLDQCANWVKILFNLKEAPQPKTVHSQWTRISKRATELRRNKLNYNIYINSPYTPPDSATKSTDLTHNKQTNTINISSSEKSVECTILPLSTKTETKSSQTNILHSTIKMEATQLGQNLNLIKKEIKESQIQFNKIKLRKGHYSIRNINKREKRAKQKNNELSREVRELKNKLLKLEVQKRNAVKMTSKWRRKAKIVNKLECPKCLEKDIKIINLNDSVRSLESEIDIAPICISDTESEQKKKKRTELNFKEVRDGHIGYSDNIRLLYMRLLSLGIPVSKCSDVVHSVLTGLTDLKFGKLPSKGTTSLIQSECEVAGQIQVADILLHGNNMTLQLDGTKKKFNEYGAYQVTLNNASGQKETYSLGMKEMLKGDTDSFIDTMLSVFRDLAETFSDDSEQINEIRTKMLANIKNLMTDRHIVNKSFKIKFEELRAELFDKYLKNFSTLSNQSKNQVVELHSLFCALHVIGNMGTVASKALKVYESIVLPPENKITEHSFDKGNARTFDLIFELSQSLTISGSQRFGRFTDWEAFLEERNIHNFLVSFLRHRFNILFVNGGAAFYHREHIAEFFHCLTAPNKLMKCISESIISPVCVAECRALGIFGVLISQPLWKIVERDIHVLDLNPYWLKLKNALSEYSVDASNLLKGKQLFSEFAMQEDEVYVSLFVPLTDEIQKFTQECLQIICFHVLQLVNRQLMDQLPNGLYFNATDTVRNETQSCPTTNRLGEKDFSDLDREVNRAPQRNTSNISGIICFRNNNAWKF